MSNFMFPVCKNINCGNKKEREIEIEKKLDEDFNKNVLFAAVDSEGEYFFEE